MFVRQFALSVLAALAVVFSFSSTPSAAPFPSAGCTFGGGFLDAATAEGCGATVDPTLDTESVIVRANETVTEQRIAEVVFGGDVFVASDPFTAPLASDPLQALIDLGGTPPANPVFQLTLLDTFTQTLTEQELTVSSDFIGILSDPNFLTGLVVISGVANVLLTDTTTIVEAFRLTVTLDDTVTPVPLPAALPLFAGGVALVGFMGWRRKRAVA